MDPLDSVYQLHLAKDAIFILLPKGSGETRGGNSTSAHGECRQTSLKTSATYVER